MYFFPNYSPSPGRESDLQLESLEARKQRATSFARFIFFLLLEYLCTNKNSIVLGPKPSFRIPESLKGNHLMIVTISDVTYKSISIIIRRPGGLSRSKFSFRVGWFKSCQKLATACNQTQQFQTSWYNINEYAIQSNTVSMIISAAKYSILVFCAISDAMMSSRVGLSNQTQHFQTSCYNINALCNKG